MGRIISTLVVLDLTTTPIYQFQVVLEIIWNRIVCLITKRHEAVIVGLVDAVDDPLSTVFEAVTGGGVRVRCRANSPALFPDPMV